MSLTATDKTRIRAEERQKIEEDRVRAGVRDTHNFFLTLRGILWAGAVALLLAAGGWLYLGAPTSGPAWADAIEQHIAPLPAPIATKLRGSAAQP